MTSYKPMLAQPSEKIFSDPEWVFEVKWDGIRALAYIDSELSLRTRSGEEIIDRFPELRELSELAHDVVLDGEIVLMGEGAPDFQAVLKRYQTTNPREISKYSKQWPVTYVVFDILEVNGDPLLDHPLMERKRILAERLSEGKHVVQSLFVEENGEDYYKAIRSRNLEGVVAKKKNSRYVQGRNRSWLKFKRIKTVDAVVVGYSPGEGMRARTFGALLLALYDDGELVYVGRVGTGFTDEQLQSIKELLDPLERERPFVEAEDIPRGSTWVEPSVVVEVGYQSFTRDGRLRAPRFLGLRSDRDPKSCVMDQLTPRDLREYSDKL